LEAAKLFSIFRRNKIEKLTDDQRDRRVEEEISRVAKCVEANDNKCTIQHLREAHKYEDCGACRRQISRFMKEAEYMPHEKQLRKVKLLKDYVEPAAEMHRKWQEMQAIHATKRARVVGKTKNVFKSTGHGLRSGFGWMKRQLT
jgi:hypothetical protein